MISVNTNHPFRRLAVSLLSALLLASCGGQPSSATSTSTSAETASRLTVRLPLPDSLKREGDYVEARSYDTIRMGRIVEGEQIEGKFQIINTSTEKPLVIVQMITGCGCTTADYDPSPVAPGAVREVTYRFDSRGRFGQQFKSIEIITSQRQCATVYLDGEVYMPER